MGPGPGSPLLGPLCFLSSVVYSSPGLSNNVTENSSPPDARYSQCSTALLITGAVRLNYPQKKSFESHINVGAERAWQPRRPRARDLVDVALSYSHHESPKLN